MFMRSEDVLNQMDDIYQYWCKLKREYPRVFKLIDKRVPFFVVKATEPYAGKVVALIKQEEMKSGTWTPADERWAMEALGAPIPKLDTK